MHFGLMADTYAMNRKPIDRSMAWVSRVCRDLMAHHRLSDCLPEVEFDVSVSDRVNITVILAPGYDDTDALTIWLLGKAAKFPCIAFRGHRVSQDRWTVVSENPEIGVQIEIRSALPMETREGHVHPENAAGVGI